MNYKPQTMSRRHFLKTFAAGTAGALAFGLGLPSDSYADDVIKDPKLLAKMSDVIKKYKPLIDSKTGYETSMDVNGDGATDKIKMTLSDGSILDGGEPVTGERLLIELDISGKNGTSKLAIVASGGNAKIARTQWYMDSELEKHLDALLK